MLVCGFHPSFLFLPLLLFFSIPTSVFFSFLPRTHNGDSENMNPIDEDDDVADVQDEKDLDEVSELITSTDLSLLPPCNQSSM